MENWGYFTPISGVVLSPFITGSGAHLVGKQELSSFFVVKKSSTTKISASPSPPVSATRKPQRVHEWLIFMDLYGKFVAKPYENHGLNGLGFVVDNSGSGILRRSY